MAVRRGTKATARRAAAPAKKTAPAAKRAPAKAVAAPAKRTDVTVYADKEPTDYHKAFARWIVKEVGYNPDEAGTKRAAFLAGVSIATAARPAFMDSEFLTEWREKTGVAKRGPKPQPKAEEAPVTRKTRRAAEPEPEVGEFDEELDEEEENGDEFDDEEFDDEEFDADDEDEEFDDDEGEEFDDEEEPEEAPAPRRTRPVAKKAPAKKAAPAKTTRRRAAAPADDDDFIF